MKYSIAKVAKWMEKDFFGEDLERIQTRNRLMANESNLICKISQMRDEALVAIAREEDLYRLGTIYVTIEEQPLVKAILFNNKVGDKFAFYREEKAFCRYIATVGRIKKDFWRGKTYVTLKMEREWKSGCFE